MKSWTRFLQNKESNRRLLLIHNRQDKKVWSETAMGKIQLNLGWTWSKMKQKHKLSCILHWGCEVIPSKLRETVIRNDLGSADPAIKQGYGLDNLWGPLQALLPFSHCKMSTVLPWYIDNNRVQPVAASSQHFSDGEGKTGRRKEREQHTGSSYH